MFVVVAGYLPMLATVNIIFTCLCWTYIDLRWAREAEIAATTREKAVFKLVAASPKGTAQVPVAKAMPSSDQNAQPKAGASAKASEPAEAPYFRKHFAFLPPATCSTPT